MVPGACGGICADALHDKASNAAANKTVRIFMSPSFLMRMCRPGRHVA